MSDALQTWIEALRADPESAVDDLVRGRAPLGSRSRSTLGEVFLDAAETAPAELDLGVYEWLKSHVDNPNPEVRRGDGADCGTAREIGSVGVLLHRHSRTCASRGESGNGLGVAGVAHVRVQLDHRTLVEVDVVVGFVPLGVIRVHSVGSVG